MITSLVSIPLVILVVWAPLFWVLPVALSLISLLAAHEYFTLLHITERKPLFVAGLVFTVLLVLRPLCTFQYSLPVLIAAVIIISLIIALLSRNRSGVIVSWCWMLLGTFYIGWFLSLLVALRLSPAIFEYLELGRNLVFLALFATFGSDTFAYTIGKLFGRHKMSPQVSPKKTWEGAIGGLIGAVAITLVFTLDTAISLPLEIWQALILGVFISVFGQFGDFTESALKRYVGVKESGIIMPGHGGILDRLDSIFLAGAVVYYYYLIIIS